MRRTAEDCCEHGGIRQSNAAATRQSFYKACLERVPLLLCTFHAGGAEKTRHDTWLLSYYQLTIKECKGRKAPTRFWVFHDGLSEQMRLLLLLSNAANDFSQKPSAQYHEPPFQVVDVD
jgi:hypothetical protein